MTQFESQNAHFESENGASLSLRMPILSLKMTSFESQNAHFESQNGPSLSCRMPILSLRMDLV
jgi:hypothetical protein